MPKKLVPKKEKDKKCGEQKVLQRHHLAVKEERQHTED
jgi:hypothetical protein